MAYLLEYPKTITFVLVFLQFLLKQILTKKRASQLPHPPGPKGLPIIGNLSEISSKNPWELYSELAKQYGDIMFFESMGTKVLVLSSLRRTTDLLEARSSIYSDRPVWHMMNGQMGYDAYFSVMRYSPMWRRQRRAFHHHFNQTVMERYHPVIARNAIILVQNLLSKPEKFSDIIRNYFNRIVIKCSYGYDILEENDPYIAQAVKVVEGFSIAAVPGTFLVDTLPFLKHVPKWMPGTAWKAFAEHYKKIGVQARIEPFERVLNAWKEGSAEPCIATRMIEKLPPVGDPAREEEEIIASSTLGVGYVAGSDATWGFGMTFILLMAMYPDIQKRAQSEIDKALGPGTIPTFEDRPKLVYVDAMLKEVARWHRQVPMAIPHATMEDDIYDGYFIPKGTIVLPNAWHILGDPEIWPNPSVFDPERHIKDGQLNKDIIDPYLAAFGFGRRICPGRHMALDSLYLLASSILAMFDISPKKDEAGNSTLKASFSGGILWQPEPFECIISPRSSYHESVIGGLENDS